MAASRCSCPENAAGADPSHRPLAAAPPLPQIGGKTGGATMATPEIDEKTRTELEAAAFRKLVEHLRARTDVQNIDMMNLAGFCRNCLSRWYREGAEERGIALADPDAREIVYGMPYKEWQAKHQKGGAGGEKAEIAAADPGP